MTMLDTAHPAHETLAPLPAPATVAARARTRRFTLDGDVALERHLMEICGRIGAGLRGLLPAWRLEAVALGGGYGRGEGGVLRTSAGDQPYNDLEFYVFLRGNRHLNQWRYGHRLHVLGEILTPQAGIEVEFRITSRRELAAGPVSMFSYDLVSGHRWVIGDESTFEDCAAHEVAGDIPLAEATRLLMNRATGLLLAAERLRRATFTPADADFVARNIAKAQLGAGDAVLTALHDYHWSVRERHRRLERLARANTTGWFGDVTRHHATGVEFKLHPTRSQADRAALAADHAHVSDFCRETWLWLENRRLNRRFRSVREYVDDPASKWPEAAGLRSALMNARLLRRRAVRGAWFRHPRERLLRTLPVLLWQPDACGQPEMLTRLQRALGTPATDYPGLCAAYRRLWEKLN